MENKKVQYQGTVKIESKFFNPNKVWFIFSPQNEDVTYKVEGKIKIDFEIHAGDKLIIEGVLENDDSGDEFISPRSILKIKADENDPLKKILNSDIFVGINKNIVEKIVEDFGSNAIEIIHNNQFSDVKTKLTENEFELMRDQVLEHFDEINLRMFLMKIGISSWSINDAVEQNLSVNFIKRNPYLLEVGLDRFNFNEGKKIADYIQSNDENELYQAAVYYSIVESGSVYQSREELINLIKNKVINFSLESFENSLKYAKNNRFLIEFEDINRVYVKSLFDAERNIKNKLNSLNNKDIKEHETKENSILDDNQLKAFESVFENQITVLTGPPGSGKTTVLKELLASWNKELGNIYLAAPTGRAASRMQEVSGFKSTTIHKLVGFKSRSSATYNQDNQIKAGLIVIDEMSMIDTEIFSLLMSAIDDDTHLLFIGDKNQLPSISSGNVFSEIISSELFSTIELVENHRQNNGSQIPILFNEINEGVFESYTNKDISSFNANKNNYLDIADGLVNQLLNDGVHPNDIQVITTKNEYVRELNKKLHPLFNNKLISEESILSFDDRVIVNKNIDDLDVSNGDIGYVVDAGNNLVVEINGQKVFFDRLQRRYLNLAYALTTHKSQGGEFPHLIFVLPDDTLLLNTRRLLYTGISRAKEHLYLLGNLDAFKRGSNRLEPLRYTSIFDERIPINN